MHQFTPLPTRARPVVRIGIPICTPRLVSAARERGYPILFSANAFARTYARGHEREGTFRRFALPRAGVLEGVDAALDSAGFVAAVRYGDYRWTVDDYLDLVSVHPWTWWASMDYCCEPELAADRPLRILRMAATASLFWVCESAARERGLSSPMPVLQGWYPSEYVECSRWMGMDKWPALVGVGSVCRRAVRGPAGVLAVVEALDEVLPPHVRLHLFGVKSDALAALASHPRIASCDSMAWDFAARRERRTGRDSAFRVVCMRSWAERQQAVLSRHLGQPTLQRSFSTILDSPPQSTLEAIAIEALALQHADLLMQGEIEYLDAVWLLKRDAAVATALVRQRGNTRSLRCALDDLLAGTAERLDELLVMGNDVAVSA